jgi:hypothetical protein
LTTRKSSYIICSYWTIFILRCSYETTCIDKSIYFCFWYFWSACWINSLIRIIYSLILIYNVSSLWKRFSFLNLKLLLVYLLIIILLRFHLDWSFFTFYFYFPTNIFYDCWLFAPWNLYFRNCSVKLLDYLLILIKLGKFHFYYFVIFVHF